MLLPEVSSGVALAMSCMALPSPFRSSGLVAKTVIKVIASAQTARNMETGMIVQHRQDSWGASFKSYTDWNLCFSPAVVVRSGKCGRTVGEVVAMRWYGWMLHATLNNWKGTCTVYIATQNFKPQCKVRMFGSDRIEMAGKYRWKMTLQVTVLRLQKTKKARSPSRTGS